MSTCKHCFFNHLWISAKNVLILLNACIAVTFFKFVKYTTVKAYYEKICKEYNSGDELMKAIVLNRTVVYYILTQVLVLGNNTYRNVGLKEGADVADQLLSDTLTIFRRQVKNDKVVLRVQGEKVFINKENLELFDYLARLFSLVIETSRYNILHEKSNEFERKLVNGQGFNKVYELKETILGALHNFGCKESDDKEEIFDESLLVFWKKLQQGEVGIYFTANYPKLENCRVFNRKYYQNSKLSTFLSGIAKNIFLNRTRTSEFQVSRNSIVEITDQDEALTGNSESETPALFLFLYYRNMVEERKLRTVISLLQYDCNLEDKEVRQLIGIANTRIHSSRLRSRFFEWYQDNLHQIPELLDAAHDYLAKRELKKENLNAKIRTIDLYRRVSLSYLDLNIFKEEFRTIPEFRQYYRIFKYIYYFISAGKPSALAGLPDEKTMRALLEIYKIGIFGLPKNQALLLLLFYGSDEPVEIIINLLKSLEQELLQLDPDSEFFGDADCLDKYTIPGDETTLKNEIYNTNKVLFSYFDAKKTFTNLISENETV